MNSDETHREVRWTEAAIVDLKWMKITKGEWKVIRAEVERVARLRNVNVDFAVCRVAQCHGEWSRLKIREPAQIRVFFSEEKKPPRLIIQAVLRRSQRTYDIAEILFKAAA